MQSEFIPTGLEAPVGVVEGESWVDMIGDLAGAAASIYNAVNPPPGYRYDANGNLVRTWSTMDLAILAVVAIVGYKLLKG